MAEQAPGGRPNGRAPAPGTPPVSPEKRVIHLRLPSELGFEKVAMGAVGSAARDMGFSDDRIRDLQTAVAEACTNAMEHGNRLNAAQRVDVVLTIDANALAVDVQDSGREARFLPPRPPAAGAGRGMGMYLIQQLVDEVEWSAAPNGGQVRMVIYLEPQPAAARPDGREPDA